jgi:hypothetical protein
MKPSSLAALLLIVFAPVATIAPCRAQTAEDATTAMARSRFKEGVSFYDKGEYELARASFLQAYALKKHPAILLNLAWSSLKSGHALDGHRYFKQFLAEGKDVTDKQRADANDGLAQTRAKLAQIDIVAPAGADVTIDAERVGTLPLAEAPLVEIGTHSVKVRMPDGSTDSQSTTVIAGERAVVRFARPAATAAPASPTPPPAALPIPPPPVTSPGPSPEPPPQEESRPPADAVGGEGHGASFVPKNLAPVYVGGVLTLGSAGLAVAMLLAKNSAQDKASLQAADILKNNGKCPPPPGGLPQIAPGDLAKACQTYANDNNDVNVDATVGNVAVVVGIAAFVGTVVYWIAAKKRDDSSTTGDAIVVPYVGRSSGGISISGSF